MPTYQTMWDDDPDSGPPRYVTYEVVSLEEVMALSDPYWRQREHPSDIRRRAGVSDVGLYPTRARAAKPAPVVRSACVCGRVKSADAIRCQWCVAVDRRIKRRMLWAVQA